MSRLAPIAMLLILAGCGFQLQGSFTAPPELQSTYISANDSRSLFYRELHSALENAGVNLVNDPAVASAIFSITYDHTGQRVLSVSTRNVPTEYEVFYTIEYTLDAGTKNLLEPQMLNLTRDYTYDSTLVLGKEHEQQLLRDAIVDDLVRIVMKQIETL